jgi:hypothetical protein
MIRVRPGQGQQWTSSDSLDAVLVLAKDAHRADRWFAGRLSLRGCPVGIQRGLAIRTVSVFTWSVLSFSRT